MEYLIIVTTEVDELLYEAETLEEANKLANNLAMKYQFMNAIIEIEDSSGRKV